MFFQGDVAPQIDLLLKTRNLYIFDFSSSITFPTGNNKKVPASRQKNN